MLAHRAHGRRRRRRGVTRRAGGAVGSHLEEAPNRSHDDGVYDDQRPLLAPEHHIHARSRSKTFPNSLPNHCSAAWIAGAVCPGGRSGAPGCPPPAPPKAKARWSEARAEVTCGFPRSCTVVSSRQSFNELARLQICVAPLRLAPLGKLESKNFTFIVSKVLFYFIRISLFFYSKNVKIEKKIAF